MNRPAIGRVGMFGGAFDPPHRAHVGLAAAAVGQLQLDQLRIFPTGQAWHKARALSAGEHRLAMAQEAFADVPRAVVDGRELARSGPTYTVETLRELRAEFPGAELMLVIGADQAEALHGWRDSDQIIRLATICIAARARPEPAAAPFDPQKLPGVRWRPVELPPMPVSATGIRARVAAGQDIAELVPPGVARYIDRHHLYRKT
ncbi:nicotinate-nucleotide adenylyltransferase [Ramlibacter tataouinensis]|uniref:Probable nicotinate-nucleotide adenylyltransferase n=1 Tax=Ramlibacter tataouinensis (strain ATCC BAA-407 / DSM 14655 / LMG 21543 / TTB310) TaxID=365046 RepID=F5XZ42_RAMTT|nr:nicotinate-nucleotide adenylyltransferase [Ramlibacter tataouinensis]AEG93212.1 Candidate nicotinate-nucleotide adenylyltransferase (Deamido-NAD(+) pyrophosphorylase) [Ramlibacter tataouinensis TTB310]